MVYLKTERRNVLSLPCFTSFFSYCIYCLVSYSDPIQKRGSGYETRHWLHGVRDDCSLFTTTRPDVMQMAQQMQQSNPEMFEAMRQQAAANIMNPSQPQQQPGTQQPGFQQPTSQQPGSQQSGSQQQPPGSQGGSGGSQGGGTDV